MHYKKTVIAAAVSFSLTGCLSPSSDMNEVQDKLSRTPKAHSLPGNVEVLDTHYIPGPSENDSHGAGEWLEEIIVTITEPRQPISLSELARAFNNQGVTIVSSMPLHKFWYKGLGVTQVDARTALYATFGSSGSDVIIDDEKRVVEIIPMPTRTWSISAPPTISSLQVSGESEDDNSNDDSSSSNSNRSGTSLSALSKGTNEKSSSNILTESDFWDSLKAEIKERLTILIPADEQQGYGMQEEYRAPSLDRAHRLGVSNPQGFGGGNQPFIPVEVGKMAINKDSGTLTVQAPRFILSQISDHIERIEGQLNAVISIRGVIFFVSESQSNQEGIDIAGFADYASDKGVVLANNALGGVTFTAPSGSAPLSYNAQNAVASTGLGVVKNNNLLQAFNAYLESRGSVQTLQRPQLTATHGHPSTFSVYDTDYVNLVSEEVSSGDTTGDAAVARQNNLTPFQFGTSLRVLPRFNPDNNLVRAQIALTQTLESGSTSIGQVVGDSNGGFKTLETAIPLDRRIDMAGEVIIESGSLVVFGGQRISSMKANGKGVTGAKDSWLGGLFGSKRDDRSEALYYVALQVDVERPDKKVKVRAFSK